MDREIMKRIPKKISILGTEYKIEYRWRPLVEGVHCDGFCKLEEKKIVLDRALKESKRQVFLHEVLHAVLFEAGISRSFTAKQQDIEEQIVDCLSRFIDNSLLK